MSAKPPIVRISKWDMYRLFNEGRYHQRLLNGEFTARIENERPATIVSRKIPQGSISKEIFYYDRDNKLVARVQNFVTPSGEIGASGKPDPKRMIINNVIYRRRRKHDQNRARLTNKQINTILRKKGFDALITYPLGWKDRTKNFWYNTVLRKEDW